MPGIKDLSPGQVEKTTDERQVKTKQNQKLLGQLTSVPEGSQRMGIVHSPLIEKHTGEHRQCHRQKEKLIGCGRAFQHPEIGIPIVSLLFLPPTSPGENVPQFDRQNHGDIHHPKNQGMTQKIGYVVLPPHWQTDCNVD